MEIIQQMKPPTISTKASKQREWTRLESRVFCFESSKADKAFFRNEIHKWLMTEDKPVFEYMLRDAVYKRNNNGRQCKYLYHNENSGRLYLDRDFKKWAEGVRDEIFNALKKYYG